MGSTHRQGFPAASFHVPLATIFNAIDLIKGDDGGAVDLQELSRVKFASEFLNGMIHNKFTFTSIGMGVVI